MQIIHWFTNNKKAESEETMTLLDAIYVSPLPSPTNVRPNRVVEDLITIIRNPQLHFFLLDMFKNFIIMNC